MAKNLLVVLRARLTNGKHQLHQEGPYPNRMVLPLRRKPRMSDWVKFPSRELLDSHDIVLSMVQLGILCDIVLSLNGRSTGIVRPKFGHGIDRVKAMNGLSCVIEWSEKGQGTYRVTLPKWLIFDSPISDRSDCSTRTPGPCIPPCISPGLENPYKDKEDLVGPGSLVGVSKSKTQDPEPEPYKPEPVGSDKPTWKDLPWLDHFIEGWIKHVGPQSKASISMFKQYVDVKLKAGNDPKKLEGDLTVCVSFLMGKDWIKKRDLGFWMKDNLVGLTEMELIGKFKVKGNVAQTQPYRAQGYAPSKKAFQLEEI